MFWPQIFSFSQKLVNHIGSSNQKSTFGSYCCCSIVKCHFWSTKNFLIGKRSQCFSMKCLFFPRSWYCCSTPQFFFFSKFNALENRKIIKLNRHKCFFKMRSVHFFFCDTTKNFKKSPKIQSKFDYICNIIDVYLKSPWKFMSTPSCIFQVKSWISDLNLKQEEIFL